MTPTRSAPLLASLVLFVAITSVPVAQTPAPATSAPAPKAKAPPLPISEVASPARTKDNVEFVIGPDLKPLSVSGSALAWNPIKRTKRSRAPISSTVGPPRLPFCLPHTAGFRDAIRFLQQR